nr:hypothetical protein A05_orf139 - Mycoplasma pneumoniae (strain ATCC 29342) [Mycoplasmoides pneumoniae]
MRWCRGSPYHWNLDRRNPDFPA